MKLFKRKKKVITPVIKEQHTYYSPDNYHNKRREHYNNGRKYVYPYNYHQGGNPLNPEERSSL